MSGIYQLNQDTGSVTLPSSGNTFIGTSTNSELYSVDSSGTVTIYGAGSGSGGTGSIDTGSFATTGSNSFLGDQNITGSVYISSSFPLTFSVGNAFSVSNPTGSMQFTGSMNVSGSITVTDPIIISGSGTTIISSQTGSFATTGSNNFTGSQFVDGNLQVTASGYIIGSKIRNAEGDNVRIVDHLIVDGTITANSNISSSGHISTFGSSSFHGLPLSEPTTTGSLWLSGSSAAHPNSGYLMVFNP